MSAVPSISFSVAGPRDAPWVTFIPGIGNDRTFWREQALALADKFRVLSFDPWGHGDSPPPPPGCTFGTVVDGVRALWEDLDIAHSHVVGLGFGGSVALALGLEAAERVGRSVACCCRPRQPEDRRDFWRGRCHTARTEGLARLAEATVDRWLAPEFRSAHPGVDAALRAMMKRTTVEGYVAYVGAFIEMDFEDRLPQIRTPTLLIAAEQDHGGGPIDAMRAMAARMSHAELAVVAGSGHIVNHERPAEVTALLRGFLLRD